ncbi:hypothetical protein [Rhodopirellula baltica]|uniref:Uncharacterized protein n=3 Tax=Rhodopirellula baltica TaxID=265606 RepID=K5D1P2_RHOBT|nr:hypothetical protein [Rhodopirellula baltica]EKK00442.1 hypothetical protein RBSH_04169 [Rhodopirellula baltica SH28]ELP34345.1 hypothetical protein RBSWK_01724 [Rhodopirellula baltica SWK14]
MNKMLIPILFAIGTALFWGCYGPTIGNAQAPRVNGAPLWSPFKPYVFIGIAYLVIAILGGLAMMGVKGDSFNFSGEHFATVKWGFLAGCLGAFGALCLTTAMMTSKGNALLVMPIVFGGAVSVTALVSVLRLGGHVQISPVLWVGMALTVVGVVIVAMNTPHGHAPTKPATDATESAEPHAAVPVETEDTQAS